MPLLLAMARRPAPCSATITYSSTIHTAADGTAQHSLTVDAPGERAV